MTTQSILFYLFAALTTGCALGVVLSRNAVQAALSLLLSLLGTAGLFVLLEAYLLATLLVLVYAGAVATLFVFIVMLIGMQGQAQPLSKGSVVLGLAGLGLLGGGIVHTLLREPLASMPAAPAAASLGASLKLYAQQLFTTYLLPVQIVAFLLLIAMVGVIVISRRNPAGEGEANGAAPSGGAERANP